MQQPSPYAARLAEILAPYCAPVEQKLRDIAARRYPASVAHISLELRGYFPDAFPFIAYFWDINNTEVMLPDLPDDYHLVVDPFELADSEGIEDELQGLLEGSEDQAEVEAQAWHAWLRERWVAAGAPKCAVPVFADSYYTDLRTDLRTGATCRV